MPSKVFISHKNTDAALAEKVARRVRVNGLETYLDTIDDALVKDGPDLADLLLTDLCGSFCIDVNRQWLGYADSVRELYLAGIRQKLGLARLSETDRGQLCLGNG